jgi:N utilization substance protein A
MCIAEVLLTCSCRPNRSAFFNPSQNEKEKQECEMEIQPKQLVMAVRQIAEEKNLPEDVVHEIIEQALAAAFRKDYGEREQEVRAQFNQNNGEVIVFISKEVVEEVDDELVEINLADAKSIKKDAQVGDVVEIIAKPTGFGRVAAQTAKQVILQKLREAERETVLEEYSDKIGGILNGVVQRVEQRVVRIDLGKANGILPMSEQIPGEYYGSGSRIKVFLKDVERSNRGPQLILSRANTDFIKLLFEAEVPEMENGAVQIKAIAREAGVRTKLAVASSVPGVDPVGTFVGGHGTRVQAVMSEIGDQEKIDIVSWDDKVENLIKNALSPTEVQTVVIDENTKKAVVRVNEDQLSVAIGKSGQNVRLASKLSGYEIDIESANKAVAEEEQEVQPEKTEEPVVAQVEDKPVAAPAPKPAASTRPKRKEELESSLLDAINEHAEES